MENQKIKEEVDLIKTTAESLVISNNADLENATNFVKTIKQKYKKIENFYEPMVTSAKNTYDTVKGERDKYLKPLKQIETEVKTIMNDYNNKLLEIQKAEEEAKRKSEEEKQNKILEAQIAIISGDNETAQAKMEEALSTTINENKTEKPQITGMSTRTITKVIVKDITKVPTILNGIPLLELSKLGQDYLIKEYKINKSLNKEFKVDGIEIKEEITTVIR